jgi:hypothetical protein
MSKGRRSQVEDAGSAAGRPVPAAAPRLRSPTGPSASLSSKRFLKRGLGDGRASSSLLRDILNGC